MADIVSTGNVQNWDLEADVVVVGGGGCGMTAALAAADSGASVLLLDRDRLPVCNTARSGGMIPAAGTRLQRQAGIVETPEQFATNIVEKNHHQSDPDLTLHLCQTIPLVVEWLIDTHGLTLELATDFLYPANTEYRMHSHPDRTGAALHADLRRAVRNMPNIQLITEIAAENLVADADGAVTGVKVSTGEYIKAQKVILACNGFGGNQDMVQAFCPDAGNALYFGGPSSTGEGIRWGQALGAAIDVMDSYQLHATIAMPGETLVSYSITMEGGFHVNLLGNRFANETRGYSEHAIDVLAQPEGIAIVIYDENVHQLGLTFPDYVGCVREQLVKSAATIEDLARGFRIDPAALRQTFDAYQASAARGNDEFGRTVFATLTAPFYGIRVTGALLHTQGGLVVNKDAQVTRTNGSVLPNLYAGGGVAAGVSGHGPGGYLSGNGLLTAVGFGYLAGKHAGRTVVR